MDLRGFESKLFVVCLSRFEGPVVLFLHGISELWYSWCHQLLSLSAVGYRAIAPDLRGYGDTDTPHLSFLSNLSLADNIFFSPIPPPLSSLSALRFLNLSNNGFNQTEYTQYTTSHTTMEPDSLHGIEYGGLVEKRESNMLRESLQPYQALLVNLKYQ
ncbi:uncharacterized protein HKW66_Vig0001290 [Vigna angularis]|uniref:AB hydrolase-1 domain-containing protein n=1 Tax=Phaseolus angularis TaxID=3914 RepID=A0A8T0LBW1_PHAAN|nr:uncharacterized protein HKW66_Vig0001290 [Vigna angularis]